MTLTKEELWALRGDELWLLANRIGICLDGVKNLSQARTRLLNDAFYLR